MVAGFLAILYRSLGLSHWIASPQRLSLWLSLQGSASHYSFKESLLHSYTATLKSSKCCYQGTPPWVFRWDEHRVQSQCHLQAIIWSKSLQSSLIFRPTCGLNQMFASVSLDPSNTSILVPSYFLSHPAYTLFSWDQTSTWRMNLKSYIHSWCTCGWLWAPYQRVRRLEPDSRAFAGRKSRQCVRVSGVKIASSLRALFERKPSPLDSRTIQPKSWQLTSLKRINNW